MLAQGSENTPICNMNAEMLEVHRLQLGSFYRMDYILMKQVEKDVFHF